MNRFVAGLVLSVLSLGAQQVESFEAVWQTIADKHWNPKQLESLPGGGSWADLKDSYRKRVEAAQGQSEVRTILREMIGKIGKSHYAIAGLELKGAKAMRQGGGTSPGFRVGLVEGKVLVTGLNPKMEMVKLGWELVGVEGMPAKTPAQFKNLDALGKIDLILVTHGHGDHTGDAIALAKKHNVPVWAPAGLNQQWQTLGELSAELSPRMNKGGTISPFPGVKITQTHAEHSSEILWTDPATKKQHTLGGGEPIGFIIELENGFTIYHMGDTGLFGDMKLIGDYYKPDLIMIPIGGHFVMDPRDAAKATREFLQPKYAIPMHYGTIPQLKGTPQEYTDALGSYPVKVFTINPGDKLRF